MNDHPRQRFGIDRAARAMKPEPIIGDGVATIRLYDAIDSWGGDWGVSAREFGETLDSLPEGTTEIRLMINSPGGEVWEGLAILNQLRAHKARVVAVVEGIAASSASFIAAGVDECVMARNSEMFIHNAWGIAIGDAEVMEKVAAELTRHDRNIASIYAAKAGKDVDHWISEMQRDRFLTADEAVAEGLADRIEGSAGEAAEKAKARFDLRVFAHREGRHAASRATDPAAASAAVADLPDSLEPGDSNPKEALDMSDTIKAGLTERLGLAADATDDAVLAAVDALRTNEPATPPAAAALPEGAVAIDADVLASLQADAAAGRAARDQQTTDRRDEIVARAFQEGRIAASSRQSWRDALEKDEAGISAILASLAPNTVPVAEIGHTAEMAEDDRLLALAGWTDETKEA